MDIFDRIQFIVDKQEDKDLAEFSRFVGVKYETLRGILKYRKSKPGYEVLKNIIEKIDWLNPEWLMTGRGEAEKTHENFEIKSAQIKNKTLDISRTKEDRLLSIIESQQKTIENLSKNKQNIAGSA